MSIWRPHPAIRVKALGLHWRAGRLLAAEVTQDDGRIKGVRPLGGSVEFGESWRDALRREFHEELGLSVVLYGAPLFFENIYTHGGQTGHEYIIASTVRFPEGAFEGRESIRFHEDNGVASTARWFDVDRLDVPGAPALFPTGLKQRLAGLAPEAK